MLVRASLAMGDTLGAASHLRASKEDHTKELETIVYQISLKRQQVCPLRVAA